MANERIDLHYQQGGSDKVYIVELTETATGQFEVNCQYGRRGGTLNHANKTPSPVSYLSAKRVFDKVVAEKTAKGYVASKAVSRPTDPYGINPSLLKTMASSSKMGTPSIVPQLLNPVRDEAELEELLSSPDWWMQQKMDGERRMVTNVDGSWVGINKKGAVVPLPSGLVTEFERVFPSEGVVLDGEIIGDTYYLFDVIMAGGVDLKNHQLHARAAFMPSHFNADPIQIVPFIRGETEKRAAFEMVKKDGGEGVVFKHNHSLYVPGRPNSGGDQLKYKFVESATVLVLDISSKKRSVTVGAYESANLSKGGDAPVMLGNVTIPPNHEIPRMGDIVEVRYLYAYRGGSLYQPVYLGVRNDQDITDCVTSQLKYKRLSLDAASGPEKDARWAW